MPIIGDVFGLSSVYDKQREDVDTNNFKSWTESSTYGCFGSGNPSTNTINRLDFSNETVSNLGNNLPIKGSGISAVSNSN
jgi:hypothetical protein